MVFTFSARFGFGTSLGTLWDFLLAPIWLPSHSKLVSSAPLGRPRADQDFFFRPQTATRAPQEASKSAPYAPGSSPWPYQAFLKLQEALQGSFGNHVGTIWEQSDMHFNAMLPPCWSRFFAEASFNKGPRPKVPGPAECA